MSISTIQGLQRYLKRHSGFSGKTINSVIIALGYHPLHSTSEDFKELSGIFVDCSKHGAHNGFTGFSYFTDTVKFFKKNQKDIVTYMEKAAEKKEMDVISMVLDFDYFRYSDDPPTLSKVGKALWNNRLRWNDFYELYNLFAWYTLDEVSVTWHTYLINNHKVNAEIAA
jgi:hypothetical protein